MVLLVFVDGVGAGRDDPAVNPLAARPGLLTRFADGSGPALPHGGRARLVDATLGVPGRPQSATGQTAILTGRNASRHLGRHLLGFPNAPLRDLLEADSVFRRVQARGLRAGFLNAYHAAYLEALGLPHAAPTRVREPEVRIPARLARPAATTVAARAAGLTLRTFDDVLGGTALYHDFTNRWPRARGLDVPAFSPEEAGRRLAAAARPYHFALFEYFQTDEAGHRRDRGRALEIVDGLDRFLNACLEATDLAARTVLVVSDHGNLEDLSIRTHTRAPVPLLAFGPGAATVASARDLTDVAGLVEHLASP